MHDVAALTAELTDMAAADQRSAVHANSDEPAEQLAWRRLTARHGDRLNEIMDEYGGRRRNWSARRPHARHGSSPSTPTGSSTFSVAPSG